MPHTVPESRDAADGTSGHVPCSKVLLCGEWSSKFHEGGMDLGITGEMAPGDRTGAIQAPDGRFARTFRTRAPLAQKGGFSAASPRTRIVRGGRPAHRPGRPSGDRSG